MQDCITYDDFAATRAIYDFVFHAFSPFAKHAQRKEGLCGRYQCCRQLCVNKSLYKFYCLYTYTLKSETYIFENLLGFLEVYLYFINQVGLNKFS